MTDKAIKAAIAGLKECRLADGGGLYLRVSRTGKAAWIYRQRIDGRDEARPLGIYPTTSLKEARQRARTVEDQLQRGCQPTDFNACTMADWFARYDQLHLARLKAAAEPRRVWARDILPVLGQRNIREVALRDVTALVLRPIYARGAVVQGNRVAAQLRGFFSWLVRQGELESSPMAGFRMQREVRDTAVLSAVEVRQVLEWVRGCRSGAGVRRALEFAMLTGQRMGAVCALQFAWVEGDTVVWPASAMKSGREHRLPIGPMARRLIEESRAENRLGLPWVFRDGAGNAVNPRTAYLALWSAQRKGKLPGLDEFSAHDLRRSMRTGLSRLGVRFEVAERILDHVLPGVAGIYDRHEWTDEASAALVAWEDELAPPG